MTLAEVTYDLDAQVGYLLRLASQRHGAIFQANMVSGLTPTQFSTLIRLRDRGPTSQNKLGRMVAMDVATTKGVVDRLRSKGLVVSNPDPGDKRRSVISLTEAGAALVERLTRVGAEITEATLGPLTQAEREDLVRLLRKIV